VRRWILWIVLGVVVLFGLMQLVPYGRNHANPPVTKEVAWDTARTRELAVGACYDCHSNLTTWPWYSNIAPVSWLVYADVKSGRDTLNFSEWDRPQGEGASEAVETVRSGSMPPFQYKPLHPAGRLTSAERKELARGLETTLASDPPIPGGGGG
jgi:mono/diheme cytochrome c family protein